MGYQVRQQIVTIPLSGTVSDTVILKGSPKGSPLLALWVPTVTSGTLTVQAAFATDAASANYLPVVNAPPGSGPFTLWTGAGSLSVALSALVGEFPALRFVSSVPQAAVRSLAAISKV